MPSYVVAGASRGLGLQFVIDLLAKGNVVIALARNPAGSTGLAAIKDKNLHVIKADITDVATLKAAAAETAKITGGSLDVLINNAAIQDPKHAFHDITQYSDEDALLKDFNESWKSNVMGPILTTNIFLPLLKKGTLKKVLTLGTGLADPALNAESSYAVQTAYCISKAPLEMVNVKYAVALKDEGFIFLLISPGVVNTAEAPPPPEAMKEIMKMAAGFQKVYPNWTGPIQPPESTRLMLDILDNVKPEDSGKFVSHWGNRQWL